MSATEQPKRPQSAYWIWLAEHRESLQKEVSVKKVSEVSKLAGERWQAMSAGQKEPYERKAAEAKAAYEEAMQNFKAQGGVVAKRGTKGDKDGSRKQKDQDAPKRPVGGAFGCFLAEKREEVKAQLPADHKITDVTKKAAELWKAVTEEEKGKYEKAYEKKQEEYKVAMEEYKMKGGGALAASEQTQQGKGATPGKRAAAKSSSGAPSAKRNRGKAGGCEASTGEKVEFDAKVLAEALKLGEEYARNLRSLAGRPDIKASGKSAQEMLAALKGAQGLLHPARRALLGA